MGILGILAALNPFKKKSKMGILNEKEVLKRLDAHDFKNLSPDKQHKLLLLFPQIDQKAAVKALEQCPTIANAALKLAKETKHNNLDNNANTLNKEIHESLDLITDGLGQIIQDEALSSKNKIIVIKQFTNIATIKQKMVKLNQDYLLKEQKSNKSNDSVFSIYTKTIGIGVFALIFPPVTIPVTLYYCFRKKSKSN